MNLSLLYLFPIFLVFSFLFLFFSGKLLVLKSSVDYGNASYEDFFLLGQIFLQKKDYNECIKNFISSLSNWDPNDKLGIACCLNTLGVTYFKIGEYEYAYYYYSEALKIFPNYLKALDNLALLYEMRREDEQACLLYQKLWHLDKTNQRSRDKFLRLKRKYNSFLD